MKAKKIWLPFCRPFPMYFLEWKYKFQSIFCWSLFSRVQLTFLHWFGNGLALNRRQAFIWTNDVRCIACPQRVNDWILKYKWIVWLYTFFITFWRVKSMIPSNWDLTRDATSYPKVGHVTEKLYYSGSNLPFGSWPETRNDHVTYPSHNLPHKFHCKTLCPKHSFN